MLFPTVPLPPPTNLMATTSATSITLTWQQPEGADAVEGYEIYYHYTIEECQLEGIRRRFPSVIISVDDSTLRRYTLINSASTPVEEDSEFQIALTAVNSVTRSEPSQFITSKTVEAGIIKLCYYSFLYYIVFIPQLLG